MARYDIERLRSDIVFRDELREQQLTFHTRWGLFSPREIDAGTRLLIDRMEVRPDDDCLDLGCGYGPIGLVMARLAPNGTTQFVDKDFVAVEYAEKNARANAIDNVDVLLSNGFTQIPTDRDFNLIATNLPAKIGNELTTLIVADAWARLRPGGRLYLVTLSGMRKFIQRVIQQQCGTYEKVKQGGIYTLHRAVKPSTDA